jgi:hypothetical protein
MQKKELLNIYYGDLNMPKGFEINSEPLILSTTSQKILNKNISFSKEWDKVDTYIREYSLVKHKLSIEGIKTWGDMYLPNQCSKPLKNNGDFTLIYGTKLKDVCDVIINYDNDRTWKIPLVTNKYIMFPSSKSYYVDYNKSNEINYTQTILYEFK